MREELIFLLNEAAELEHSLCCSYLFAAYSLKEREDEGLSPPELDAVQRWKQELNGVAIEEMFHLAVVTNLLTAVGGPPHFDRPNFPHGCAYYLPDFQIELLPFGDVSLDHFIAIEQPDGTNTPALIDAERRARILGDLENEIGPDPHHFDSQGDVYGAILACLDDLTRRLGDEGVFVGVPPKQALHGLLAGGGWKPITDLASARRAFDLVVEQGEGASPDSVHSHHARFLAIKREYEALTLANPRFVPARPVVANPFTRTPPEGLGHVNLITDEFSIQVSDLFNESYGALLQLLGRLFISFEESEEEAIRLEQASIEVMEKVLHPLGSLLCQLPAGSPHEGMTAGPSFVLRTVHSLPEKRAAWHVLRERFEELGAYANRLAEKGTNAERLAPASGVLLRVSGSLQLDKAEERVPRASDLPLAAGQPLAVPDSAQVKSHVEISMNGPYVVHGNAPLLEMAPVHTFNGEPVDWHTLREIPVRSRPFRLCRCGQSSNKPFCDSSHARTGFDGTETATHDPYLERATVTGDSGDSGPAIVDSPELCFRAGFCRTRTTSVWQLLADSAEDPAKRELARDMVWRCPSGRLSFLEDGNLVEPNLPESIAILPGGPIWVRGGLDVDGSGGHSWEKQHRVTLCRCGGSRNKPFCDGTHQSLHFDER